MKFYIRPAHNSRERSPRWHKDILQRVAYYYHEENSYIDTADGRLRPLFVQATDIILSHPPASTWRRRPIRNVSPRLVRLANWTLDQVAYTQGWGFLGWAVLGAKWTLSCLALMVMVRQSSSMTDTTH